MEDAAMVHQSTIAIPKPIVNAELINGGAWRAFSRCERAPSSGPRGTIGSREYPSTDAVRVPSMPLPSSAIKLTSRNMDTQPSIDKP